MIRNLIVAVDSRLALAALIGAVFAILSFDPPDDNWIEPLDATCFTFCERDRAFVLNRLSALAQGCRFIPASADGRIVGFRIAQIDPNGLVARLGLRRYDVLLDVNGYNFTDPDKMLGGFASVSHANEVLLRLARGGVVLTLIYRLAPFCTGSDVVTSASGPLANHHCAR